MAKDNSNGSTISFVCVQNAGRSQIATAYAQRENDRRQMDVEILSGGTDPADSIHEPVKQVLEEDGIDVGDRNPEEISEEELRRSDYVITMGCSADEACPANLNGETRDWDLTDPDGQDVQSVRLIRDDIKRRITIFFDELETH